MELLLFHDHVRFWLRLGLVVVVAVVVDAVVADFVALLYDLLTRQVVVVFRPSEIEAVGKKLKSWIQSTIAGDDYSLWSFKRKNRKSELFFTKV